jgi:peptide subunit release factor 1 (eRF1)
MNNPLLRPLIDRTATDKPVLSLYLDMSVNSENKRTHLLFLQQQRSAFPELHSDRPGHHREPLGETFERVERWIDANYRAAQRGLALFLDIGGPWIHGIQLPMPLENRLVIGDRPVLAPLAEILSQHRRYGVALVDREGLRLLDFHLGELRLYLELRPEAYPTPHDVQKGGWAARDYQKYKAEETRQFFRKFSSELMEFDQRQRHDYWILAGTDENVKHFREYLPKTLDERVIHTAHLPVDASETEIVERLQPFFQEQAQLAEASTVDVLRDRLRTGHYAIAGVSDTLEQLQEGKVGTLVIARDFHKNGAQCTRCGFYLERKGGGCPYCGGTLRADVDLIESMIRMAASQEIELEFVDPRPITELNGVGGLLKF